MGTKIYRKTVLIWILAIFCCLFLVGIFFSDALANQKKEVPDNPIEQVNEASSKVLWTGKGYKTRLVLSNPPETITETVVEAKEPEEQKEEQKEDSKENTKKDETKKNTGEDKINYDDQYQDNEGDYDNEEDDDTNEDGAELPTEEQEPEVNYSPSVASDLTDGETVNGTYRTFYVRGEDYKGNYLGASNLEVYGNKAKIYSTTDEGDMVKYRLDLVDGANTIKITVTDKEGRTTTVTYTIYKGEEREPEPAGTITFSLEASTVGLGNLIGPSEEVYYEGEQLSYVIDRVLQKYGYTYRYEGSLTNGFYLKHVIRSGITNGYSIPEDLYAKLQEVNCEIEDYHLDSLGEFDFTKNSGWMYYVNGAEMSSGISTYYPADGDEIRIRFSLYAGADVGGSMQGETWGDW